jgi:hypothetical protein
LTSWPPGRALGRPRGKILNPVRSRDLPLCWVRVTRRWRKTNSNSRFPNFEGTFFIGPGAWTCQSPRESEPDFDDRQRQGYRPASQAGPGNDIHAGSPSLQKAPTRGPASLARFFWKAATNCDRSNPRHGMPHQAKDEGTARNIRSRPRKQRMVWPFGQAHRGQEPKVRIHLPPARSLQRIGSAVWKSMDNAYPAGTEDVRGLAPRRPGPPAQTGAQLRNMRTSG